MTSTLLPRPLHRPDWVPDTIFYQVFPDRFRNGSPHNDPPGTVPWGTEPDREHFQGGDLAGVIEGLAHMQRLGIAGLYLNPIFTAGTNHRYDTWDYFTVDTHLGDIGVLRELVAEAHHRGIRVLLDGVFNHCGDGHPAFRDWRRTERRRSTPDGSSASHRNRPANPTTRRVAAPPICPSST